MSRPTPFTSHHCGQAQRRKEARPGELLEAALDLFVEKGFAATRVDEVAARAGVSKGTLFLYFPSKEELFKAVVRENIAGRFAEWTLELDAFEGSTDDLLRYCYKVWWERIGNTKTSGITKLMLSEAHHFPEITEFYQRSDPPWPDADSPDTPARRGPQRVSPARHGLRGVSWCWRP
jgi:AcrR family transcriptional regulator